MIKSVKKIIVTIVLAGFAFAILPAEETVNSGKDIFLGKKCNTCHAIKSQEISGKDNYPDLSAVGAKEYVNKDFLVKYLQKEEKINGKAHALKFKGSDEELSTLVDWLLTLK